MSLSDDSKETREFVKASSEISDKIYKAIQMADISLKEFAKEVGVEEGIVKLWLSGTYDFKLSEVNKFNIFYAKLTK